MRWWAGVVVVGLLSAGTWGSSESSQAVRKVDLNTATVQRLQTLKGIGPAKAKAIVQHRKQSGLFTRMTQLLHVKGIGPKLLKKLQSQVVISKGKGGKKEKQADSLNRCPVRPELCR